MFYIPTLSSVVTQLRHRSLSLVTAFYLVFTVGYAYSDVEASTQYDLMLVGGGLKTCSSQGLKNCKQNSFSNDDLQGLLYEITADSVGRFWRVAQQSSLNEETRAQLNQFFMDSYATASSQLLTLDQLRALFVSADLQDLYQNLTDANYYALLDSFEVRQLNTQGQRKRESASLRHTAMTASVDIYQEFVRQAQLRLQDSSQPPTIVVVTASSRDPFEVADFYSSVFEQAGAKVVWLPLDQTLQQAMVLEQQGGEGCRRLDELRAANLSFYRQRIYPQRVAMQQQFCREPQRLLNAIEAAQGVFFNGGDQSLTLAALQNSQAVDNLVLRKIKQRLQQGQLIVGGTSAGTAVQAGGVAMQRPVPMITNGDPDVAMHRGAFATPAPSQRCDSEGPCNSLVRSDDLTFRATGGTGLAELGLLDTHFSERDRETRLAIFTATAMQRFAFGVDEATALMVSNPSFTHPTAPELKVLGANGVFALDMHPGSYARKQGLLNDALLQVEVSGLAHYLADGARAVWDSSKQRWQFSLPGESLGRVHSLSLLNSGVWRDQTRKNCGSTEAFGWQMFDSQYLLKASKQTRFHLDANDTHCHYVNLPFAIQYVGPDA